MDKSTQQIKQLIKEMENWKKTPEEILNTFVGAGILTPKGKITKPYRPIGNDSKRSKDV